MDFKPISPVESVRLRPGMYVGLEQPFARITAEVGNFLLWQTIAGTCNEISILLHEGVICMSVSGGSVNLDFLKGYDEQFFLSLFVAKMAGKDDPCPYAICIANALSRSFNVSVHQQDKIISYSYAQGVFIDAHESERLDLLEHDEIEIEFVLDTEIIAKRESAVSVLTTCLAQGKRDYPQLDWHLHLL